MYQAALAADAMVEPSAAAAPQGQRRARSIPAIILGLVLVAMAAGQLSDMDGFADLLVAYRLVPEPLLAPLAWAVVGSEALAGLALLFGRRFGATLALVVALWWSVLAGQAFARGIAIENCGCFGVHLGQPLRWWVLAQDASFVASAVFVRRALGATPEAPAGGGPSAAGTTCTAAPTARER